MRKHDELFHGQPELTGTVTITGNTFATEFKEDGNIIMNPNDEVNMLKWIMGNNSKKILIEWETTESNKYDFENNLETNLDLGQFVELPKYRLRLGAHFTLLKGSPQRYWAF